MHVSIDGQACAICALFFKVEYVLLLYKCVKWSLSFKVHLSIHAGVAIYHLILSLTTDIMYISVFPRFWNCIPMIQIHELLMTVFAASVNSPSM